MLLIGGALACWLHVPSHATIKRGSRLGLANRVAKFKSTIFLLKMYKCYAFKRPGHD